MNIQILPVLTISLNDAVQAEKLCDYMALLKNKQPSGYILLAFAWDVHAEMQTRIRIAAEIGFETVDVFQCPRYEGQNRGRAESINWLFQKVSSHVARHYKLPFLLIEPDCTPLTSKWLQHISDAYTAQPKLYMGNILADADKRKCIGRVAVYPRAAAQDLQQALESKQPFEIVAGEPLVARASKTRLIQMLPILDPLDREKIRPDAVLVHGDKQGILLSALIDERTTGRAGILTADLPPSKNPAQTITGSNVQMGTEMPVRIEVKQAESGAAIPSPTPTTLKPDGRTKAGRAARAQNNG